MTNTVLIVEDELKLAQLLADYVTLNGYEAHIISNGSEVVDWVKSHRPIAILLDIMLPEKNGVDICKEIRVFSQLPILMVTAKVEEIDRLIGLELGADDYICKPFSPREVMARLKTVLRRCQGTQQHNLEKSQNENGQQLITQADITLDENRFVVRLYQNETSLTAVEFQLLKLLFSAPERIFSREKMMETMYSDQRIVNNRTIDSHIKKLRKKLLELYPQEDIIQSVYGIGYRLSISS